MRQWTRLPALAAAVMLAACDNDTGLSWFDGTIGSVAPAPPPTILLDAPVSPAAEGTTLTATVRLSRSFGEPVTVPFTVTLQTVGVNDIVPLTSSPVTIAAGQSSATIQFTVVDDPFQEEPPVETFELKLGSPSVGQLGATSAAVLSITDSDSDGLGNSLSGRVTDATTGTGLADVAVFATAGGASAAAVSDAQGFYRIPGPPAGASVLVIFSKTGYAAQVRSTAALVNSRAAVVLNVPMTPYAYTETFDPTMAHVTMVPGSTAQISFAANSLETTAGGAAPTGNVTVSLTPLAAGGDVNLMPGTYRAGDGVAAPVPVESFGALHLSLADSGGNLLRLSAGQSAAIRIPAATRGVSLPASVSLYYYDSLADLWRAEGSATLQGVAPDQYYEATVTRLPSFWAAHRAYTAAAATGCVVDLTGSRVGGATVVAEGITYSGSATAVTDATGNFSVPTLSGDDAYVQATFRTGISNAVNVPPLATSPCLVVYAGAASIKLTWGLEPFDLDSHTYGPNQAENPNHVHWTRKGSLTAPPFVALDVDDVTGFGPEVTTIVKAAMNRKYRFMVRNFSETYSPGQTGSPAKVELFIKGRQHVFTPPPGEMAGTSTWHVFDLQTDSSCEVTVVSPAPAAPWLSLGESAMDDIALNPNTDDNATYCN